MTGTIGNALLAGLLVAAAPLAAQDAAQVPASSGGDIVVEGDSEAPDWRKVTGQASSISRVEDPYDNPLARFEQRVCPGVMGLPVDYASIIVDRIRFDAEQIGLRLATDGACRPNILVIFVTDLQGQFAKLRKHNGDLLANVPLSEVHELQRETGPVLAWASTSVRSRHGEEMTGGTSAFDPPVLRTPTAQSHIYTAHRIDIDMAVVMIDASKIDGMSVVQLADYAAMRALARTRTPADGTLQVETILGLFEPGVPRPYELTDFDRAYLATLYSEIPNLPGVTRTVRVAAEMRKRREGLEEGP